jgi:hypothetical protein
MSYVQTSAMPTLVKSNVNSDLHPVVSKVGKQKRCVSSKSCLRSQDTEERKDLNSLVMLGVSHLQLVHLSIFLDGMRCE